MGGRGWWITFAIVNMHTFFKSLDLNGIEGWIRYGILFKPLLLSLFSVPSLHIQ